MRLVRSHGIALLILIGHVNTHLLSMRSHVFSKKGARKLPVQVAMLTAGLHNITSNGLQHVSAWRSTKV